MRLGGEPLEGRAMLATYTWDGGLDGSGTNFLDPVNWVGDVLPQAGDTAVIGSTGSDPTIRVQSASVTGWHIRTSRPIVAAGATLSDVTVTDTGGGSLQVRADSTFTRVATSADVDLTAVDTKPRGRFVRVELPGDGKFLHIAEVQVFRDGTNIALGRPASQSTTDHGGAASRAVDGNTSGIYWDNSVSHTAYQSNPWWEVDLGEMTDVDRIVVWNRTDGGLANRLDGFRVVLLDEARGQVWSNTQREAPQTSVPLTPVGSTLTVIGGLELRDGATIRLGDATGNVAGTLVAAGPQTWSGTGAEPYGGTILLGASASNTIRGAGSVFDPGGLSNESWTIDGISIEGTAGTITEDAQFPVRIVNQGRISADGSGGGAPGMIMLLPRLFTNLGSIVVGAGQRLRLAGNGTASFDITDPSSSITVDHGTLVVDGGWTAATMGRITRTGGSIRIVGLVLGGGELDLDAAGGDWELAGGGIAHLALRSPSGASRLVLTSLGGWIGNLDLGADIDGTGMRIAIVCATFNFDIVDSLRRGAVRGLTARGVRDADIVTHWVPGAFELPVAAKALAATGRVDAVIALGAVIRGDTPHFEYVSGEAASGLQRAALDTGVHVAFGVLTVNTLEQALERCAETDNKGEEAAVGAIMTVQTLRTIKAG